MRLPAVARILLVDAEPAVAKAMRRVLSAHKVEATSSGLEALAFCRERPFDLVLYDVDGRRPAARRRLPPPARRRTRQRAPPGLHQRRRPRPEVTALVNETGARCVDKPFDAAEIELLSSAPA